MKNLLPAAADEFIGNIAQDFFTATDTSETGLEAFLLFMDGRLTIGVEELVPSEVLGGSMCTIFVVWLL